MMRYHSHRNGGEGMTDFNHAIDRCPATCEISTMPVVAVRRKIVDWWLEWPFGDDSVDDRIHSFDAFFKGVTSTLLLTGHQQLGRAISDMYDEIKQACFANSFYGGLNILYIVELRHRAQLGDQKAREQLQMTARDFPCVLPQGSHQR